MPQNATPEQAQTPAAAPKATRWHPSYAMALAIVFAASVAAFFVSPQAGRFVTFLYAYGAAVGCLLSFTIWFGRTSKLNDNDFFFGGACLIVLLITAGVAISLPFAMFEYVETGVLR